MRNKGRLFLIPTAIAAVSPEQFLPPGVREQIAPIRYFLAENLRTARRYLGSLHIYPSIEALSFAELDKRTRYDELESLCAPLMRGDDMGILSESGCPGIADPGAIAVEYAHQNDVRVIPLVGPSSILLALMASGLNGQHFAFRGYLPVRRAEVARAIAGLENESRTRQQTQVFIETPYRNNSLCEHLIKHLSPATRLCVAVDITGEKEMIRTLPISVWRKSPPVLPKLPTVFLFLA